MCLSTVEFIRNGIPKLPRKEYIGYKVFHTYTGELSYEFMVNPKLVFNEWLTAVSIPVKVKVSDSIFYQAGFRVFTSEADAKDYACGGQKVVKVRCKGLLAIGTQLDRECRV